MIKIASQRICSAQAAWAAFCLLALNAPADPLPLVQDGQIRVVVVAPSQPAPEEVEAARDLAACLERMTGDAARTEPAGSAAADDPSVHVGRTGAPEVSVEALEAMGPDAILMRRVGNRLFLCGAKPQATRMAVSRFLQEEGGVRWYMPGELGEQVPARTNWAVDTLDRLVSPTFLSRSFSGLKTAAERTWALRNGLQSHMRLGHNLHRVFPPSLFDRHPDFFPIVSGKRLPPPARGGDAWQPCFGNPEAAEYAAREAAARLTEHPDWNSFSLAMNDSLQLCECPACRELMPGRSFRGMPDASDLVFTFVSRAAQGVAASCPGRMITAYAYQWCENAPSFDLPPNVAVYLTADRSFWHDPSFHAEDEELIRRWTRRCSWVGLYDYYYGEQYAVPRVFATAIAGSLKFASSAGVKGFHAGLHPFWALDGPKAWLAAQLIWDADQDPTALLDEYYREFFGEAEAPMRRFYEFCEMRWRNQGGRTFWLKGYKSWRQFEIFPAAARAEARAMLDRAAAAARGERVRGRVAFVSKGFRVTEIYGRIVDLADILAKTDRPYPTDKVLGALAEILALRAELLRSIEEARGEDPPSIPPALATVFPFPPEIRLSKRVAAWIEAAQHENSTPALKSELSALSDLVPDAGIGLALRQAEAATANTVECLRNGGFETPDPSGLSGTAALLASLDFPRHWAPNVLRGSQPAFVRWGGEARSGRFSVRAEGADLEWAHQPTVVTPGAAYRFSLFAKGRLSPGASVSIQVQWHDPMGEPLAGAPQVLDLVGTCEWTEWTEMAGFSVAPPGVALVDAQIVAEGFMRGDWILIDDASLRLLWEPIPDMN